MNPNNKTGQDLSDLYRDLPMPTDTPDKPVAKSPSPVQKQSLHTQPLKASPIETPNPTARRTFSWTKDVLGLGVFVLVVIVGAFLINSFIFRSFDVIGPSMEPTLEGGINNTPSDRLIVNRVPVTIAHASGKQYLPERGQIIVFKNPEWTAGEDDEYIVKRVVGLPGERITVDACVLKVFNEEHPDGYNPYTEFKNLADNDSEINTCVAGDGTDVTVPKNEIFVVGDHRVNGYSMDSRNGEGRSSLGTIPLEDIIGPVSLRIWPFNMLKIF